MQQVRGGLEHLWHVFFRDEKEAVYCPSERQCRCDAQLFRHRCFKKGTFLSC